MIVAKDPIDFLKKWRKQEKISQAQLAKMIGVSNGMVGDFERGRRDSPRFCLLVSVLLTEYERLMFFDLVAMHYAENKEQYQEMNRTFEEIKRRGKLHQINKNDISFLRAMGHKIDSTDDEWKRERKPRKKRKK